MASKFEQELSRMVESVGRDEVTPMSFRTLVGGLRGLLAAIGREGLEQLLQAKDAARSSIEFAGERLRHRGVSEGKWISLVGRM